jgi:hypothetical protein
MEFENSDRVPVFFWDWEGNTSHALTMPQLRVCKRVRVRLGSILEAQLFYFILYFYC